MGDYFPPGRGSSAIGGLKTESVFSVCNLSSVWLLKVCKVTGSVSSGKINGML